MGGEFLFQRSEVNWRMNTPPRLLLTTGRPRPDHIAKHVMNQGADEDGDDSASSDFYFHMETTYASYDISPLSSHYSLL